MIHLRSTGLSRFLARIRDGRGVGLDELLMALLVLNIGLFATLGAFTSGALALQRASHVSTASAIADRYMECFRDVSFANTQWPNTPGATALAGTPCAATTATGSGGSQYSTVTGPEGDTIGAHQYSPGESGPLGLPVRVPWVWAEGLPIGSARAKPLRREIVRRASNERFMGEESLECWCFGAQETAVSLEKRNARQALAHPSLDGWDKVSPHLRLPGV